VEQQAARYMGARTGLFVPLVVRDRAIGVVVAQDKQQSDPRFTDEDVRIAEAFAERAAVAIDLSERVAGDALRRVVEGQELERKRLAASEVTVIGSDRIEQEGLQVLGTVLDELEARVGRVYMHLDLDVLDAVKVGRANEFASENGLSAEELEAALGMVRGAGDNAHRRPGARRGAPGQGAGAFAGGRDHHQYRGLYRVRESRIRKDHGIFIG
jgi:hypothetical protein